MKIKSIILRIQVFFCFELYRDSIIQTNLRYIQLLIYHMKQNQTHYIVDSILGRRRKNKLGQFQYRIKWKGWSARDSTWEPIAHLQTVMHLVKKYQNRPRKFKRTKISKAGVITFSNQPNYKRIRKEQQIEEKQLKTIPNAGLGQNHQTNQSKDCQIQREKKINELPTKCTKSEKCTKIKNISKVRALQKRIKKVEKQTQIIENNKESQKESQKEDQDQIKKTKRIHKIQSLIKARLARSLKLQAARIQKKKEVGTGQKSKPGRPKAESRRIMSLKNKKYKKQASLNQSKAKESDQNKSDPTIKNSLYQGFIIAVKKCQQDILSENKQQIIDQQQVSVLQQQSVSNIWNNQNNYQQDQLHPQQQLIKTPTSTKGLSICQTINEKIVIITVKDNEKPKIQTKTQNKTQNKTEIKARRKRKSKRKPSAKNLPFEIIQKLDDRSHIVERIVQRQTSHIENETQNIVLKKITKIVENQLVDNNNLQNFDQSKQVKKLNKRKFRQRKTFGIFGRKRSKKKYLKIVDELNKNGQQLQIKKQQKKCENQSSKRKKKALWTAAQIAQYQMKVKRCRKKRFEAQEEQNGIDQMKQIIKNEQPEGELEGVTVKSLKDQILHFDEQINYQMSIKQSGQPSFVFIDESCKNCQVQLKQLAFHCPIWLKKLYESFI